jgi:hypothetical protein
MTKFVSVEKRISLADVNVVRKTPNGVGDGNAEG